MLRQTLLRLSKSPFSADVSKAWGRMAVSVSSSDVVRKESAPSPSAIPNLQRPANLEDNDGPSHSAYREAAMAKLTDPAAHVKSIEEELQESVAAALRKSGHKVEAAIAECKRLADEGEEGGEERFEEARKKAHHCRWEFMIHRQACGFVSGNSKKIEELYPIPPKRGAQKKAQGKQFGDQLDWWQSKGRWR
mmetsp:Transcript_22532/g.45018  ORF Transcript_22532/g.45018 Transcript_22532/m.45018 type:complete len:192 (+) Transcript_22532:171-746(+)